MTTQKIVDDSIAFLETVRQYNYSSDRIIVMDETGLWSNVAAPRTYSFVGGTYLAFPSFRQIFFHPPAHPLFHTEFCPLESHSIHAFSCV